MEFYQKADTQLNAAELQRQLGIGELSSYCSSIDRVLSVEGDSGEIYCLWGQFEVNREVIRNGLRFTLPDCSNALAWTLTVNREETGEPYIRIHCTINQPWHDPDFIDSIEQFVHDWKDGISGLRSENQDPKLLNTVNGSIADA